MAENATRTSEERAADRVELQMGTLSGEYQKLRYGTSFSCTFPATNGLYDVTLELLEPNKTAVLQRRFTVAVNGQIVGPLDLFALVGLRMPYKPPIFQALVTTGQLRFDYVGSIGNAVGTAVKFTPVVVQPPGTTLVFVDDEIPQGVMDGVNRIFTLAAAPNPPGSLQLRWNGVWQEPGIAFTLAGAVITFLGDVFPDSTDIGHLFASYRK